MQRLIRFIRLERTEKYLLVETALLFLTLRAAISLVRFDVVLATRRRLARSPFLSRDPAPAVDRLVWAVDVASRVLRMKGCLIRALVMDAMLMRRQLPSELRIGVAKDGETLFEAHAWVESGGRVLVGAGDIDRFSPLNATPARTREAWERS